MFSSVLGSGDSTETFLRMVMREGRERFVRRMKLEEGDSERRREESEEKRERESEERKYRPGRQYRKW